MRTKQNAYVCDLVGVEGTGGASPDPADFAASALLALEGPALALEGPAVSFVTLELGISENFQFKSKRIKLVQDKTLKNHS